MIAFIKTTFSMDIGETFRSEDLSKTDFFDFVTAPSMGVGIGGTDGLPGSEDINESGDQSLQSYDQFWSSDKDTNRIDAAIFEDLDKYCWQQQHLHTQHQTSLPSTITSSLNNQSSVVCSDGVNISSTNIHGSISDVNTDGQIYTLTVLNGSEPWLKKDSNLSGAPTLDLDNLLGNFPAYIKSEFSYEENNFNVDNIKEVSQQQESQQQRIQNLLAVTVPSVATPISTNPSQFQTNNNSWHIANTKMTEENSPESLLRSALQGKGYSKGLQLENDLSLLQNRIPAKSEEVTKKLFCTKQENLAFTDSTLSTGIFEDVQNGAVTAVTCHQSQSTQSTSTMTIRNNTNPNHSTTTGIIVDDMFLSLETTFTDDLEKIKRIASEVQQLCSTNEYPEVIMEITAMPHAFQSMQVQPTSQSHPPPQPLQSDVTTSNQTSTPCTTKTTTKKHKRLTINNVNNNNNNNNNNNSSSVTNNNSPTLCNGQRKERSLHYCSICSKGFKDKYSVNVHIRTHTGEKPFACSLCGKSFRQKAHLAKHYQTHLAQKSNGNVTKGGKSQQSINRSGTGQVSSQVQNR